MNILFVCSMARLRSKTAYTLYQAHPYDEVCRYVGTDKDSQKKEQLENRFWQVYCALLSKPDHGYNSWEDIADDAFIAANEGIKVWEGKDNAENN